MVGLMQLGRLCIATKAAARFGSVSKWTKGKITFCWRCKAYNHTQCLRELRHYLSRGVAVQSPSPFLYLSCYSPAIFRPGIQSDHGDHSTANGSSGPALLQRPARSSESVLEAISRVSFPVQSNTCTRFPTEFILRPTAEVGSSVSIVPHTSRTNAERISQCEFRKELEGFDGLGKMIEAAKAAMGIQAHGKTFSRDLLRIEITGPGIPQLTVADLPGLIHSATRSQTEDDVELTKDVVREYSTYSPALASCMSEINDGLAVDEPRSVILAVISAKMTWQINRLENGEGG